MKDANDMSEVYHGPKSVEELIAFCSDRHRMLTSGEHGETDTVYSRLAQTLDRRTFRDRPQEWGPHYHASNLEAVAEPEGGGATHRIMREAAHFLYSLPDGPNVAAPLDMILYCPLCHLQHIDAPDDKWTNPPHRSHLCAGCGHIWRPADLATNGVQAIKTKGAADSDLSVARDAVSAYRRQHPEIADLWTAENDGHGSGFDPVPTQAPAPDMVCPKDGRRCWSEGGWRCGKIGCGMPGTGPQA